MKELVCIVCPKGCRLHVDEENDYSVTGNSCPRGAVYGHNEIKNPTAKLMSIMQALNDISLKSPVTVGQVVLANVCGTDANVVVTKSL